MKKLLFVLGLTGLAFGLDINEFVAKTIANNPDLLALQKNLDMAVLDKELAGKLDNPALDVNVANILENAPLKRDFSPMQQLNISITQIIPTDGKLSKKVSIENAKILQIKEQIKQKTLDIESALYAELINASSLSAKKKLYEKYLKNYELLLLLLNSYNASGIGSHIAVIKAEIEMQNIKNELFNIDAKIKSVDAKIKSIANDETIKPPNIPLEFAVIDFYKVDTLKSPQIKQKLYDVSVSDETIKLDNAYKYPDIGLTIGYSAADSAFQNYMFFGVTIPLPIYGREEAQIKKSVQAKIQKEKELENQKNEINYEIADMKARYEGISKSFALIDKLSKKTELHSLETVFDDIKSSKASGENAVSILNEIVELEIKTVEIKKESQQIKVNLKRILGEEI